MIQTKMEANKGFYRELQVEAMLKNRLSSSTLLTGSGDSIKCYKLRFFIAHSDYLYGLGT